MPFLIFCGNTIQYCFSESKRSKQSQNFLYRFYRGQIHVDTFLLLMHCGRKIMHVYFVFLLTVCCWVKLSAVTGLLFIEHFLLTVQNRDESKMKSTIKFLELKKFCFVHGSKVPQKQWLLFYYRLWQSPIWKIEIMYGTYKSFKIVLELGI